jgi:DnaK suppressor protein
MAPTLPPDYRPSDDEDFMNPQQLEYFRQKLQRWRAELLAESSETLLHLKEESLSEPDVTDRATLETERAIELRTRDRERKLISKIDAALLRIEDGSYGYCEETEEPIGLRRLEARPIATATSAWSARTATIDGASIRPAPPRRTPARRHATGGARRHADTSCGRLHRA